MAVTYVQAGSNSDFGGSATIVLTGVAAGSTLVAGFSTSGISSVSSSIDGAFTLIGGTDRGLAYLLVASSGNHTITFTPTSSPQGFDVVAVEYSGIGAFRSITAESFDFSSSFTSNAATGIAGGLAFGYVRPSGGTAVSSWTAMTQRANGGSVWVADMASDGTSQVAAGTLASAVGHYQMMALFDGGGGGGGGGTRPNAFMLLGVR